METKPDSVSGRLVDGLGRAVEYLRVSVTDRCDLACSYCAPPSAIEKKPRCGILRFRDILSLVEIFAGLGVRKVRVTGGEPLIRKGVVGFIRQIGDVPGVERVALTTNGMNLARMAASLKKAGVWAVNISLDTLDGERYRAITGRGGLGAVMEGIRAAVEACFGEVKINAVVMRGVNCGEVERIALLTRAMPVQARFIEYMPSAPGSWDEGRFYPIAKVEERVRALGRLTPVPKAPLSGPARVFRLDGAIGEIGFISAVSRHFCGECGRARLTSSGTLLTCLFGGGGVDLGAMLRGGSSRGEIEQAIISAFAAKNGPADIRSGGEKGRAPMISIGG